MPWKNKKWVEGRCFASALSSSSVSLLNLQFYQGKYEAGGGVGGGLVEVLKVKSGGWKWRYFTNIYLSLAVSRTTISRKLEVFLLYSKQSFFIVMEKSARPNANQ